MFGQLQQTEELYGKHAVSLNCESEVVLAGDTCESATSRWPLPRVCL